MRPLPEIRTASTNNHTTKGLSNGESSSSPEPKLSPGGYSSSATATNASGNASGTCNGVDTRPLIVTRSKAVKVLRSGRRALLLSSSPWKKSKDSSSTTANNSPHSQNHVNGYAKSLKIKNRALNGISSPGKQGQLSRNSLDGGGNGRRTLRTPSNRRNSSTGSPGKIRSSSTSSAYAKHYKSYRRNSSTTRRNLMLSRSSASKTSTPQSASTSTNQRSLKLKFKSSSPTSGRLRLRPSDLRVKGTTRTTSTTPEKRRILQRVAEAKVKVNNLVRKRATPKSPLPSSSLTNGTSSHTHHGLGRPRSTKSRSASASSTSSNDLNPSSTRVFGSSKKEDKVHRKSRSALWVLNCEAEEFLFGETAADKHELELPAKGRHSSSSNSNSSSGSGGQDTPPAKKRRRWRETELSHLLETSPFLESKLRSNSSPSSANSSPGEETPERSTPTGQRINSNHKKANCKLNFDREQRKQKYKNGNTSAESSPGQRGRKNGKVAITKSMKTFRRRFEEIKKDLDGRNGRGVVGKGEEVPDNCYDVGPSSFINFNCELLSPRSNNSVDKAVILRETLDQVKWSFSFENPPSDESWYKTFSRGGGDLLLSYKSFLLPSTISGVQPPLVLPYQLDKSTLLRKTRKKKLPKNARKSPRCHASTLAILSSTDSPPALGGPPGSGSTPSPGSPPSTSSTPLRHRDPPSTSTSALPSPPQRSTLLPPISALHSSAPSDASLEALLISTSSHHPPPQNLPMLSPFTKFVAENSVRITRKRNSSAYQDPYQLYQRTQQSGSSRSSQQHAHPPTKHQGQGSEDLISAQQYLWDSIQFLSDPYVVSLLAGDEPLISPNSIKCSNSTQSSSISTRTRHASTKSGGSGRVPTPKSSPNKGGGGTGTGSTNNNGLGGMNGKNGVSVGHPLRSPPPPHTRSGVGIRPQMSPQMCKSSPIVMVSDIYKNSKKLGRGGSKGSGLVLGDEDEHELLFVGEGLPPLPLMW